MAIFILSAVENHYKLSWQHLHCLAAYPVAGAAFGRMYQKKPVVCCGSHKHAVSKID
jgi:hypothetical protein